MLRALIYSLPAASTRPERGDPLGRRDARKPREQTIHLQQRVDALGDAHVCGANLANVLKFELLGHLEILAHAKHGLHHVDRRVALRDVQTCAPATRHETMNRGSNSWQTVSAYVRRAKHGYNPLRTQEEYVCAP